ncbi:MAG: Unknown protein [uncultured Campylobacterales bacterium]|uniref:Uncharacterized protein n=1 Tax=uncultured Campylobacterales bacterium TaxID=352960 RepID=A0A6S6SPP9_9BACT|nr:MAG: Unknown protein [uncultured Campylobacterales bacterium]
MNKTISLFLLCISLSLAVEFPVEITKSKEFSKRILVQAKVVEAKSQEKFITPFINGQVKEYYVKEGDKIDQNQKIAKISSLELLELTSKLISLRKEYTVVKENFSLNLKLHKKGLLSSEEINNLKIKKLDILSQIEFLSNKLKFLNIKTNKPISEYFVYSNTSGVISNILVALNQNISGSSLVEIQTPSNYQVKAFIPQRFIDKLRIGQKAYIEDSNLSLSLASVLPKLDEHTKYAIAIFTFDNKSKLSLGSYQTLHLVINDKSKYVAIKKSALAFIKNKWVVFTPKKNDEHNTDEENHDGHEDHSDEDKHLEKNHDDEHEEDEHKEEFPYEVNVIEIITQNDEYIAVKGLKEHSEYISKNSHYLKSMLLKSSLDGHGH